MNALKEYLTKEEMDRIILAKSLLIDKDLTPIVNNVMKKVPMFRQPIENGNLNFDAEIPGYNGNRWYLGLKWDL